MLTLAPFNWPALRSRRTKQFNVIRDIDDTDDEDSDVDAGAGGGEGGLAARAASGGVVEGGGKGGDAATAAADAMDSAAYGSGGGKAAARRRPRRPRRFADQLMLSEWMRSVPADLGENWGFLVCPKGKRCLVVAAEGQTTAYGRNGKKVLAFPSALPGGSRKQRAAHRDRCVLDCVLDFRLKTFYVIDLMCWKGHDVYDSDMDFRRYWRDIKFQEEPGAMTRCSSNPYVFIPMAVQDCTPAAVQEAVGTRHYFSIDGLLFYHKQGHYTPGSTPLVLWAKPAGLSDTLGIPLPEMPAPLAPAPPMETAVGGAGAVQGGHLADAEDAMVN